MRKPRGTPPARIVLMHVTTIPMSLIFFRGQVGYLRGRGVGVHVLSSPGPQLEEFGAREGVGTSAVEMPRRVTPLADLRALRGVLREIRRVDPVIVHGHTPKGGLLAMIAAALHGTRIRVYHMRGLPVMGATGWRRVLLRATERLSCRLAHQVLCVSHSVRRVAIAERICPPDRIKVLLGCSGNGVDAAGRFNPAGLPDDARASTRARLGIPPDAVVIGFVGRIVRDKGVIELAGAFARLRERHPSLHLLLVGPFERQDPVPDDIEQKLRSDPRVHLAGADWDTPPLYAAMDVVALPTYREGFPNVPLEAAAMELPVVATRVPGCVDAVADDETGLLVEARDDAALAGALECYVNDGALRRRHGLAGRARVLREFRQEAIWEALLEEYRRLLQVHGVASPLTQAGVPDEACLPAVS